MANCIQCQQDKEMWQLFVKYKAGPTASEDRYCCYECNALNSRINRLGTQHEELVKEFSKVRADKKATFYEENAKCFGADLVKNMSAVVDETNTHRKHSQFEAKGTLMDEMQVREHFKHMPSRAEATLRNAKKKHGMKNLRCICMLSRCTQPKNQKRTPMLDSGRESWKPRKI